MNSFKYSFNCTCNGFAFDVMQDNSSVKFHYFWPNLNKNTPARITLLLVSVISENKHGTGGWQTDNTFNYCMLVLSWLFQFFVVFIYKFSQCCM